MTVVGDGGDADGDDNDGGGGGGGDDDGDHDDSDDNGNDENGSGGGDCISSCAVINFQMCMNWLQEGTADMRRGWQRKKERKTTRERTERKEGGE